MGAIYKTYLSRFNFLMKNKIAIQMDDIKSIDFDFDSSFIIGLEGQ